MSKLRHRLPIPGIVLLLGVLLASCSPGGLFSGDMMWAPHRENAVGAATLQSALIALTEGDHAGQIVLTESEFGSLLRAALVDNADEESIVHDIQVLLEPDTIYLKILLREGVIPGVPSDVAVNVEGDLMTKDGRLQFTLNRAGVGALPILSPALLSMIEEQLEVSIGRLINRASPLNVKLDQGTITIDVP